MKNDYEIRGDVTAIIIKSPKYGIVETLISTSKLEMVNDFPNTWRCRFSKYTESFYIYGSLYMGNGKQQDIPLHRFITKPLKGMVVDHYDNDTLNNTDDNLRVCTNMENQQNRKGAQKGSRSGVLGVSWHKKYKKWRVRINVNGKCIEIGNFKDIKKAEQAAIEARKKYMTHSKDAS